ncbi:cupin domain-containing protein [Roseibacterium sp. SDUM158017]|uniref:cupin domain-containing protein n=1 Tax=Roseicyclus salinarum TaxID=3036773 RepID=UPI0024159242|nr:cupin domain-containing protein [Roseibacterium sp. SDUM158017]MDG4649916.1 cupin domain-containing protein [Roseibacterium sp. SDUM158017]
MAQPPIHIRPGDTELRTWDDPRRGRAAFRLLVSADGGPSSKLVQGVAEIAPGESEARHRHDRPETAYVLSGGGRLTLAGQDIVADAGEMFFIPEGLTHGWLAGEEGLQILWTFPGDRFADVRYDWAED